MFEVPHPPARTGRKPRFSSSLKARSRTSPCNSIVRSFCRPPHAQAFFRSKASRSNSPRGRCVAKADSVVTVLPPRPPFSRRNSTRPFLTAFFGLSADSRGSGLDGFNSGKPDADSPLNGLEPRDSHPSVSIRFFTTDEAYQDRRATQALLHSYDDPDSAPAAPAEHLP